MVVAGHTYSKAFKAWRPKSNKLKMCYNEESTKIYTPVEYMHAPL